MTNIDTFDVLNISKQIILNLCILLSTFRQVIGDLFSRDFNFCKTTCDI